jgi:hypothetical protein
MSDDNLIPPRRPLPETRYVHVLGFWGEEHSYYAAPTDRRTLLVRLVFDREEETVTFNARLGEPPDDEDDDAAYTIPMRPPGKGWTFHRHEPPASSAWRRKRKRRR